MSGDQEQEFEAWAVSRQRGFLRSAILLTGDQSAAEDLVQEALLKVADRWSRLRHEAPDAYARRIIYNAAVSRWRRRRRETPMADLPETGVAGRSEAWVAGADVRAALQALTPRQRAVLVLRYYDDLSEQQIAQTLGVTAGTVKSQAHVALRRLREEFGVMVVEEAR
ncbi:SigE family RNA polymerase sigma factor [Ornithinimicrobium ciconiae]|uniref:SigE family RNA polymerase sigma factor n=1 Tax=Ornithinimicrobium ciconiae TaxID=2594265 RepID=A0A516G7H2_9MICO|nr:SigE family RNA polymerase sigma factor [Ornithinimicrobium ciconiae]QDO87477.1 SigE family RNA polymerase sigma factor [Ornithinimicrobium ciconiae]